MFTGVIFQKPLLRLDLSRGFSANESVPSAKGRQNTFLQTSDRCFQKKELLFRCAVRLFGSTRIVRIRGQSDRNIRKVRGTMFKKIRKRLLAALTDKAEKQQPMTLLEKEFLRECGLTVDNGTKEQYNR